jgi:hypothetical protein
MPFPSFDTATSAWAPQAQISWSIGPAREFEFVRFPNRLATEGEATAFALQVGEEWIDRRLRRLRRGIGARRARVIDMIGAQRTDPADRRQREMERLTETRRESLTFKQFKSVIAKSGLNVNDQLLQKSYAALVKLRSQQHLSWAQARKKIKQSQADFKAGGSPRTRSRAMRLPLTERDWRRIG